MYGDTILIQDAMGEKVTWSNISLCKCNFNICRKGNQKLMQRKGGILEDIIKEDIEFKDVHFRYPARPDVQIFAGFSLCVPNGTTAALVGQSGGGKSTVINLLERFYDPDAGDVLIVIDGVNLKNLHLRWIREQIGLVSQEPTLFIDEEIITAITLANAKNFIHKLPQEIDTMAGNSGKKRERDL